VDFLCLHVHAEYHPLHGSTPKTREPESPEGLRPESSVLAWAATADRLAMVSEATGDGGVEEFRWEASWEGRSAAGDAVAVEGYGVTGGDGLFR